MEAIQAFLDKLPRGPWTEERVSANFDKKGNDPERWRGKAEALLDASASLEEQWCDAIERVDEDDDLPRRALEFMDPALMLRAMAFECLFKARLAEQGTVLASGGRFRRVPGVKGHDLVGLARKSGFEVSEQEAGVLLRRLARWISAGRVRRRRHPLRTERRPQCERPASWPAATSSRPCLAEAGSWRRTRPASARSHRPAPAGDSSHPSPPSPRAAPQPLAQPRRSGAPAWRRARPACPRDRWPRSSSPSAWPRPEARCSSPAWAPVRRTDRLLGSFGCVTFTVSGFQSVSRSIAPLSCSPSRRAA